jgi:3-mercaptopyruvate sulfurtransferase SseA
MGTLDAYRKFELDCMVGSFQHSDTAMRHRVTNRAAVVAVGVAAAGGSGGVTVYEGSALEWAEDPALPVVQG